jgi:nucleoside-diphosphate-sugar epimerase
MSAGSLIALTGATGFVGRHLVKDLKRRGYRVRALLRHPDALFPDIESAVIGDIASPRNLAEALRHVDYIVHSAGIAHAMSGRPEDDYRTINTQATTELARAGAKAGVRRFIFLSSIRAQAGATASQVLTEDIEAVPTDAYGRSKLEAERALADVGLDWCALRPVLVYGSGVKGNLASLFRIARMPVPLPFGSFQARRSLVSIDNLAAAVDAVISAEQSPNKALIVADRTPVTLAEIISAYRSGLGRPAGLVPVPAALLTAGLRLLRRSEMAERLNGSLVVDSSALRSLGYEPQNDTIPGIEALGREWSANRETG